MSCGKAEIVMATRRKSCRRLPQAKPKLGFLVREPKRVVVLALRAMIGFFNLALNLNNRFSACVNK